MVVDRALVWRLGGAVSSTLSLLTGVVGGRSYASNIKRRQWKRHSL